MLLKLQKFFIFAVSLCGLSLLAVESISAAVVPILQMQNSAVIREFYGSRVSREVNSGFIAGANIVTPSVALTAISQTEQGPVPSAETQVSVEGLSFYDNWSAGATAQLTYYFLIQSSVNKLIYVNFDNQFSWFGLLGLTPSFNGPVFGSSSWNVYQETSNFPIIGQQRIFCTNYVPCDPVKYSNIYRTTLNTNSIYRVELRSDTNNYYYNQTLYFGAAKIALSIGLDVGLPENIVFSEGIGRTAVPEPSAWILMLFGFGLIGLGLRHKAGFRGHEFRARYTN
jgi:hypothetical protein